MKFKFIDLFAGIGGFRLALESVGGECVFSSEIDPSARKTYESNFGDVPSGDICKIDAKDIPDFDVLAGGFPCQAFSVIGKKEGFANETSGTLFFEIERILKAKTPRAFILENVKNLVSHAKGATFRTILEHLEALGYNVRWKVLNALDYGLPQKRERTIIVGFRDAFGFEWPDPIPRNRARTLKDILEEDVPERYWASERIRASRNAAMKNKDYPRPFISHANISGLCTPHPYSGALRWSSSHNALLVNNERRLTEREMLRLQGFPDAFKIVVPYTRMKAQCGNSVPVPMIEAVCRQMVKAMEKMDA